MMRPDEPPIVLSRGEHVADIMSRWRLNQIDKISTDLLFEEHLRRVAEAIDPTPAPRKINLPSPSVWLLACLLWAPAIIIAFTVLRP